MILLFPGTATRRLLALLCVCLLGVTAAQARTHKSTKPRSHSTSKASKTAKASKHSRAKGHLRRARKPRGQQRIDSERASQIQAALIREHYLDGEPTGTWDQRTQEAMTRYQADHGWQTKALPDSRALIALGLGPSQSNLLNPQTAALPQATAGGAAPGMSSASEFVQPAQHR